MIGKRSKGKVLLTLTNRVTKQEIIELLPAKTAESVVNALDAIEKRIGTNTFRTNFKIIIWDNGSEFWRVNEMEQSITKENNRLRCYFARPYRCTDRGLNENRNRIIRKLSPKGKTMYWLKTENIKAYQNRMNNLPLRSLKGLTPNEYAKIILTRRFVAL